MLASASGEYQCRDASVPELSDYLSLLRERRAAAAHAEAAPAPAPGTGVVYLVGTGPGDPGLLTLNALQLMQTADVVLYDRLVSPEILELVNGSARMVYVGKQSGFHTRTQDEIHQLLEEFASAGARVIRLKGGDPLIFGRGGEEIDYLQQRGIAVHVVPGITAAVGIAAELGIPLTHRGVATSVRFLTGHSREGGDEPAELVANAADPNTTLVVYMGLATLPSLTEALLAEGLSPTTPAVAVERGTTSHQRRVFSRLADLPDATRSAALKSPTLVVIGACVALSPLWPFSDAEGASDPAAAPYELQTGPVGQGVYFNSLAVGGLAAQVAHVAKKAGSAV